MSKALPNEQEGAPQINGGGLLVDEPPEFIRKTLEVLRQTLEDGRVTISRVLRSTTFPAEFMLVAAMNPCACGYRSDPRLACGCSPRVDFLSKPGDLVEQCRFI